MVAIFAFTFLLAAPMTTFAATVSYTPALLINNGAESTNSRNVRLNINSADFSLDTVAMMVSEDVNFTGAAWEIYATQKSWTLSDGDGVKTVFVKLKDSLNNEAVYDASILLDTQAPEGSLTINNGDPETLSEKVLLNLSAFDPEPSSGLNMMLSNYPDFRDGVWEPYSDTKEWILNPSNGLSRVYVKFKDNAGNESAPCSSSINFAAPVFARKWNSASEPKLPLLNPTGTATDAQGNIYLADSGNHRIIKLDPDGNVTGEWSGPNFYPYGIAVDGSGNIFVTEASISTKTLTVFYIYKFNSELTLVKRWSKAGFNELRGAAVDRAGNLYVAGFSVGGSVIKFDNNGNELKSYPANGATAAVAVDSKGNIYVSEGNTHLVGKYAPDGTLLSSLGQGVLTEPKAIAIDSADNVYVADAANKFYKYDAQ